MKLRIDRIEALSPSLKRFTLAGAAGALPSAGAGAHIILHIPTQARIKTTAYSLAGVSPARDAYEIIVRRVPASRGGSAWLHQVAAVGDVLEAEPPQNFFCPPRHAKRHLLISAGIGVTPFLSYAAALAAPFELHHVCKTADAPAFAALLPRGAPITLHSGRAAFDLKGLLAAQKLDTHLSVCGPDDFMAAVVQTAAACGWPRAKLHRESFGGVAGGAPFTVTLAKSAITLEVGPEESLLEALERAGLNPPSLCRGGACGACELAVLGGIPEHHDHVLSTETRAAHTAIMTCVSRAKTPELVLDF
jgi:ferredoxin-NADP reductase